ncbi:MAG: POTRA domain-containing protein, partial [Acidobacteriota bacterium]
MRRSWASVLTASGLAVLLVSPPARADVRDYLGLVLVDLQVESGGLTVVDPSVLQLIELRVGERLSMERVRESIDHLVGTGRFEDVRVLAERTRAPADGVIVRWRLVPVQRVSAIDVIGRPALGSDVIRTLVADRVGTAPQASQIDEITRVVRDHYRDRGYRRAVVGARLDPGRAPDLVTLTLSIDAGPRTTIEAVQVEGDAGEPAAAVIDALRVQRGRAFDQPALDARVTAYEQGLHDLGYYQATAEVAPAFSSDDTTVSLKVTIDRGPQVRVVLAGDEVPEGRRDTLVPIRRERSVDLDLLEDTSRNIESFFRQQGYRAAEAPYVRELSNGIMTLTFTVTRGALHRLASIEVTGNDAVSSAALAPLIPLQPGEPFVDSRVAAVAAAVTDLYRVRGYARVEVRSEILVSLPPGGRPLADRLVSVRLAVTEGPQTTVRRVSIEGAAAVEASRVAAVLALAEGRPFYRPLLDEDRRAIERLYYNEGFREARVDPSTTLSDDSTELDLRWRLQEGPRTLVDRVLVAGNDRTSAELIQREVGLTPGSPLGEEALVESQRRLAALGLFRRIRIVELPHGASSRRDVLVEVEEAPPTTIAYGGGIEAGRRLRRATVGGTAEDRLEVAPRGFFEVGRRNLWGKNRSISLFTRVSFRPRDPAVDSPDPTDQGGYGFNEYRVVGTFREPRPFDAAGDLQFTGFLEQAIRSSFNFGRRGVRAEYARRIGPRVTATGRYALDRTRLFDEQIRPEDQLLIDRLFPRVRLSTFTGAVLRDSRDDVLEPSSGTVLGLDGTLATRALGSEVGFVKSFGQAFAYRRVPGAAAFTVAAGIRLGLAVGFERRVPRRTPDGQPVTGPDGQPVVDIVSDAPASERFFAGGDTTVRGFVLDRLGTDDTLNTLGFPTGGNGLAVVNVELRSPYWKGLGAVGFLDAGNVFKRAGDISLRELRPA